MYLPDFELRHWAEQGGLDPYDPDCVNPASIDLRWSGRYCIGESQESHWSSVHEAEELTIRPQQLYLMDTQEYVTIPDDSVGILLLKSTMGRNGLQQLHTGLCDPGFHGTVTWEVFNAAPWAVVLKRGQRIVQLALVRLTARPDRTYSETGHYTGQNSPQPSKWQ